MRRTILPFALAAALLVAGACGDDDDDGGVFGSAQEGGDSGESGFPGGEDSEGFPGGEEDSGFPSDDGGGGGGYNDEAYSNFVATCASYGAGDDLCDCAWDEVVATVPYEEYAEFEAEIASDPSASLPGFILDAVEACGGQT